jgi:hypothetical protein
MKSISFPGSNVEIGKGQPEYNSMHAMVMPGHEGELIMCFELTDEEIETITKTKKIYYSRWTFGQMCRSCGTPQGFLPMKIFTDLSEGIELKG